MDCGGKERANLSSSETPDAVQHANATPRTQLAVRVNLRVESRRIKTAESTTTLQIAAVTIYCTRVQVLSSLPFDVTRHTQQAPDVCRAPANQTIERAAR